MITLIYALCRIDEGSFQSTQIFLIFHNSTRSTGKSCENPAILWKTFHSKSLLVHFHRFDVGMGGKHPCEAHWNTLLVRGGLVSQEVRQIDRSTASIASVLWSSPRAWPNNLSNGSSNVHLDTSHNREVMNHQPLHMDSARGRRLSQGLKLGTYFVKHSAGRRMSPR